MMPIPRSAEPVRAVSKGAARATRLALLLGSLAVGGAWAAGTAWAGGPAWGGGAAPHVTRVAGSQAREQARAQAHTVTIEQLRFEPAVLVVHRGDRIVWVNKDLLPHTVTALSKAFDSGTIPADGVWKFEARNAGEYAYACRFHPMMKGKLIVR